MCRADEYHMIIVLLNHLQDWPAAVNHLLDGCTRLAQDELVQVSSDVGVKSGIRIS